MEDQRRPVESSEDKLVGTTSVKDQPEMSRLNPPVGMDDQSPDPPFETQYKKLFDMAEAKLQNETFPEVPVVEECELPLIDLSQLSLEDPDQQQACKKLISRTSQEWGFFQVINHGISSHILKALRAEQVKLLKKPFLEKASNKELNLGNYQWGTPSATCLEQLCWSESFHVPLNDVMGSGGLDSLRSAMEQFAAAVSELAQTLAGILAEEIGYPTAFFKQACRPISCYLRLNRYPPCPTYPHMLGLTPHTDSDFLTVLHQDSIGGLQIVKNGKWIAVKPNPSALIINVGDLFQAWSNDIYRSVEHGVVANGEKERFSSAYFFCPSYETVIESDVYRSFSFGEYRRQVQEDVKIYGYKIGLSRFLGV